MYNTYKAYFKFYLENYDKLIECYNNACWSSLNTNNLQIFSEEYLDLELKGSEYLSGYDEIYFLSNTRIKDQYIYIYNYRYKQTEKYINSLINIINQITECKEVIIDNIKYIKFKLTLIYNKDLFLLNFIRTLWYENCNTNRETFFITLINDKTYTDPIQKLMHALKESCETRVNRDHSNCCDKNKLKIRTLEEYNSYNFDGNNGLIDFLCK